MLSTLALRRVGSKVLTGTRWYCVGNNIPTNLEHVILDGPNKEHFPSTDNISITLEDRIKHWKKANDIFFGPDRDLVNWPHPEYKKEITETYQLGFIPTRWFMHLYPHLGVSGCYTLFWGSFLFLASKELVVLDAEFMVLAICIIIFYKLRKMFGDRMQAKCRGNWETARNNMYVTPLAEATAGYKAEVDDIKQEVARQAEIPAIFLAKQEQVDLQLEVQYRQRLAEIYETVKKRLEYQAEIENTRRSFEQNHMVNWIVDSVKKSITPQQEKENIANCIRTLKTLSATAAVKN